MNSLNNAYYSVLNATTGSFFPAVLEGMKPAISVNSTDMMISVIAALNGSTAVMFGFPVTEWIILFIGMISSNVAPIPISPDSRPMMNVSALKIEDIL